MKPLQGELTSRLREGEKIRFFYGEGNPNNCIAHIRALIDGGQVVFRVWSQEKQRWRYHVEPILYFSAQLDHLYET